MSSQKPTVSSHLLTFDLSTSESCKGGKGGKGNPPSPGLSEPGQRPSDWLSGRVARRGYTRHMRMESQQLLSTCHDFDSCHCLVLCVPLSRCRLYVTVSAKVYVCSRVWPGTDIHHVCPALHPTLSCHTISWSCLEVNV